MTSRTQDRLRDAADAFGQLIRPEDVPELRLPARRATGAWLWPAPSWQRRTIARRLVPLAAAAAVLALIGSLLLVGRVLRGGSVRPLHGVSPTTRVSPTNRTSPGPTRPPGEIAAVRPAFVVTAASGRAYVRSSATGQVIARIQPPVSNFSVDGIAVAPGGKTVFLAGQVPIGGTAQMRIEFFSLPLGPRGRPGRARELPGAPLVVPVPITSNALINLPLAVSPDGRYLAYPTDDQYYAVGYASRHPAGITVLNVATGARRTWTIWAASATQITQVSWSAGGRIGVAATLGATAASHGTIVRRNGSELTAFLVLNTAAASPSLAGASRLLAYGPPPALGGTVGQGAVLGGVISPDGRSAYVELAGQGGASRLVRISTATGKITSTLLSRPAEPYRADPVIIDGRYLLLALGPSTAPRALPRYTCGHLAGIRLPEARPVPLPLPLSCSTVVPPPPLQATW